VLLPRHTTREVLSLRVGRTLIYALAGLSIASAQNLEPEEDAKDPDEEESTGFLDGSLMPDGGILKNVLIPQYTRDLLLSATLRAETLTIVTQKIIDAANVRIEFFNPDRSTRGRIDMATARYNAIKQLLTSDKPVSLVSDDLTATGSSLVYDLKNTRGFLSGPVTATTLIDQSTSMNTKPVRQAIAAGSLMMAAATPLPAQQDPSAASISQRIEEARLSPYELARITKESETAKPLAKAAADRGNTALEDATHRSEEATATLADFLSAATLTTLLAEPFVPAAATSTDVPRPNIPADPTKTRITSDDGAFFDSKNGLLIFLKNVVVRDPRFSLSGADELKVFFDPKEVPAAAKATPKPPAGEQANPPPEPVKPGGAGAPVRDEKAGIADAKFGKPNRIIATGTVVVEYQSGKKDDPPVKASARTVIYDLKKEEFILRGGSPWVLREGQLSSVPGNDAYIVIQKDGSFVTGNGGIDAQMDIKDKTKEDEKKNR
jgi:lipopolysaccharide export system protein LptA